ncbi:MAG TPA: KTSC domain-containing protein [Chthoniobacterales bacterium]|nr:KTSC domain-containing protein [Chthoniobacterales bacterium]
MAVFHRNFAAALPAFVLDFAGKRVLSVSPVPPMNSRTIALVLLLSTSDLLLARSTDNIRSAARNPVISHIPRNRVPSSAIASLGYSKRRHILELEFINGAIYRYLDVPPFVYRELMSADSKARYYDLNIKGKYLSVHVRPRVKDQTD